MDDAVPVSVVERVGNLDRVAQSFVEPERASLKSVSERFTLEIFHNEKIDTVFATHVIERTDVRMIQARNSPRLALETLTELRIVRELFGKHFDRHGAVEPGVVRFVNFPHSARADRRDDLIRAQSFSRFERHDRK